MYTGEISYTKLCTVLNIFILKYVKLTFKDIFINNNINHFIFILLNIDGKNYFEIYDKIMWEIIFHDKGDVLIVIGISSRAKFVTLVNQWSTNRSK